MKKVILLSLMLVSFVGFSQEIKKDSIYANVEVLPEYYDGGKDGFMKYILQGLKFKPHENVEIDTKINIIFVVERNGKLSNVKLLSPVREDIDKQIIKRVKKSKKWKPALVSDKPVRTLYGFSYDLKFITKNVYLYRKP